MKRILRSVVIILCIAVATVAPFAPVAPVAPVAPALAVNREFEAMTSVFWDYLEYRGEPFDYRILPPDLDVEDDVEDEADIYYEWAWACYFDDVAAAFRWHNIEFSTGDMPPTHKATNYWDMESMREWSWYFTEMYYIGGAENVLASEAYAGFWKRLTVDGKNVDPFSPPPNYAEEYDIWKPYRGNIGYHWYWQYYLAELCNDLKHKPGRVKWKGKTIDLYSQPGNYDLQKDIFSVSRAATGYVEYKAAELLGLDLPDSIIIN